MEGSSGGGYGLFSVWTDHALEENSRSSKFRSYREMSKRLFREKCQTWQLGVYVPPSASHSFLGSRSLTQRKGEMGVAVGMDALSERATMMRKSVQKSQTISDSIVSILGSFDHRLFALETIVQSRGIGHWLGRSWGTSVSVSRIGIGWYAKNSNLRAQNNFKKL